MSEYKTNNSLPNYTHTPYFNIPKKWFQRIRVGKGIRFTITCTPKIGVKRDILQFNFMNTNDSRFAIGRYVTLESGDVALYEELKPTKNTNEKTETQHSHGRS